jgi:tetratricopeptide (TPR) repeat protein
MHTDAMTTIETWVPSQTAGAAAVGALGTLGLIAFLFSQPAPQTPAPSVTPASKTRKVTIERPTPPAKARVRDADRLLVEIDARIKGAQAKWQAREDDWINLEQEAAALMARAKVTGDLSSLTVAEERLDTAFERAPAGTGPFIALAQLKLTLHKIDEADKALEGYGKGKLKQRQMLAASKIIAADIALQRGDYAQAAVELKDAVALFPVTRSSAQVRLAHIHEQLGEKDKAAEVLDALVSDLGDRKGLDPSWTLLRRGILELDRGNVEVALTWFDKADVALPGWYLVMEHRAECLGRLGRHDEAIALYREVLKKNPSPEFYAAIAGVLEAKGNVDEAKAMNDKAAAGFAALMVSHPEAMVGHALDWFLEGDDAAQALTLATKNVALRPSWEAKTKLLLAQIRSGKLDGARKTLDEVKRSPYRHPDLYGAEAFLLQQAGDRAGATAALAEAEKLEKGAAEGYDWLKPVAG